MHMKALVAASVVAAFAIPGIAGAAGDTSSRDDAGAEKMFKSLDKNKDGYLSKEETKGTPHDKDFTTLDKNRDGKLSRQEHAAAPEHAGSKAGSTGATGGGSTPSGASGGASGGTQGKGAKY